MGGRVSWSIIFCLSIINSPLGDSIKFNGRHHVPGAALLLFVDEEDNWEDYWVVTLDGGGGYCSSVFFTFSEVPKCNTESVEQCSWLINNATEVDGERSFVGFFVCLQIQLNCSSQGRKSRMCGMRM